MEKVGVTHIGTVTSQGAEVERKAMLRVMGAGLVDDTQEVERLRAELGTVGAMSVLSMQRDALQARVSELEAELAAQKEGGE